MSPPPSCASACRTNGPTAPAPYTAPVASAPRSMNDWRVMPWISTASSCVGELLIVGLLARDIGLDLLEHLVHRRGLGEAAVRRGGLAEGAVERRRVAGLDRVDRQRRRQDLRVLDLVGLAQVRRGAQVLDRGGQVQDRLLRVERELAHRLVRQLLAELLQHGLEGVDVLLLVLAELLAQLQRLPLEHPALGRLLVEVRLQVLEGQRVLRDADVAGSELGRAGRAATARRARARAGVRARLLAVVATRGDKEREGSRTARADHLQELLARSGIALDIAQGAALRPQVIHGARPPVGLLSWPAGAACRTPESGRSSLSAAAVDQPGPALAPHR